MRVRVRERERERGGEGGYKSNAAIYQECSRIFCDL